MRHGFLMIHRLIHPKNTPKPKFMNYSLRPRCLVEPQHHSTNANGGPSHSDRQNGPGQSYNNNRHKNHHQHNNNNNNNYVKSQQQYTNSGHGNNSTQNFNKYTPPGSNKASQDQNLNYQHQHQMNQNQILKSQIQNQMQMQKTQTAQQSKSQSKVPSPTLNVGSDNPASHTQKNHNAYKVDNWRTQQHDNLNLENLNQKENFILNQTQSQIQSVNQQNQELVSEQNSNMAHPVQGQQAGSLDTVNKYSQKSSWTSSDSFQEAKQMNQTQIKNNINSPITDLQRCLDNAMGKTGSESHHHHHQNQKNSEDNHNDFNNKGQVTVLLQNTPSTHQDMKDQVQNTPSTQDSEESSSQQQNQIQYKDQVIIDLNSIDLNSLDKDLESSEAQDSEAVNPLNVNSANASSPFQQNSESNQIQYHNGSQLQQAQGPQTQAPVAKKKTKKNKKTKNAAAAQSSANSNPKQENRTQVNNSDSESDSDLDLNFMGFANLKKQDSVASSNTNNFKSKIQLNLAKPINTNSKSQQQQNQKSSQTSQSTAAQASKKSKQNNKTKLLDPLAKPVGIKNLVGVDNIQTIKPNTSQRKYQQIQLYQTQTQSQNTVQTQNVSDQQYWGAQQPQAHNVQGLGVLAQDSNSNLSLNYQSDLYHSSTMAHYNNLLSQSNIQGQAKAQGQGQVKPKAKSKNNKLKNPAKIINMIPQQAGGASGTGFQNINNLQNIDINVWGDRIQNQAQPIQIQNQIQIPQTQIQNQQQQSQIRALGSGQNNNILPNNIKGAQQAAALAKANNSKQQINLYAALNGPGNHNAITRDQNNLSVSEQTPQSSLSIKTPPASNTGFQTVTYQKFNIQKPNQQQAQNAGVGGSGSVSLGGKGKGGGGGGKNVNQTNITNSMSNTNTKVTKSNRLNISTNTKKTKATNLNSNTKATLTVTPRQSNNNKDAASVPMVNEHTPQELRDLLAKDDVYVDLDKCRKKLQKKVRDIAAIQTVQMNHITSMKKTQKENNTSLIESMDLFHDMNAGYGGLQPNQIQKIKEKGKIMEELEMCNKSMRSIEVEYAAKLRLR